MPLKIAVALAFSACGTLALSATARADSETTRIITRVIEAYGGEKAMGTIHGYHANANQWASQSDVPIHAERWFARPDRLRLELDYPDHHETRVTDGAAGWAGSSIDSMEPVNQMKLQAMRLQTARLDLPLRLLEEKDAVESRGKDPMGRAVLRLPIDTDLYIDYHIDLESYHITRATTGMTRPHPMEFAADYEQFHPIDGVLVPFHEVSYAGVTVISTVQLIDFEWNPENLEAALRVSPGPGD